MIHEPFYTSKTYVNERLGLWIGWVGGIDNSERLGCILPYTVIRKGKIFRMVRFQVETIYLGQEFGVEEEKSFLNRIIKYFRSTGIDVIIPGILAEYEEVAQGCAVIPFSSYSGYYMDGGSISKPLSGAMNLLQWEGMCFFRKLGVRYYKFVGTRIDPEPGSKQEGLSMFKQRFSGELRRGYIWKYSFHPSKNYLYSIGTRTQSGGDIVDREKHKLGNV